jgi:hypothetical protein
LQPINECRRDAGPSRVHDAILPDLRLVESDPGGKVKLIHYPRRGPGTWVQWLGP